MASTITFYKDNSCDFSVRIVDEDSVPITTGWTCIYQIATTVNGTALIEVTGTTIIDGTSLIHIPRDNGLDSGDYIGELDIVSAIEGRN